MRIVQKLLAVLIWLPTVTQALDSTVDNFRLQGAAREAFSDMLEAPYNPVNITRGDSMYWEGVRHSDLGEMGAGLLIKSLGYQGDEDLELAVSTLAELDKLLDEKDDYVSALNTFYPIYIVLKLQLNEIDEAETIAQKLVDVARRTGNSQSVAVGFYNMGLIYMTRQNLNIAIQKFKRSAEVAEHNGYYREAMNSHMQMAYCHDWLEESDECRAEIDKAIEISREIGSEAATRTFEARRLSFTSIKLSDKEVISEVNRLRSECDLADLVGPTELHWIKANYYAAKRDRKRATAHADSIEDLLTRAGAFMSVYLRLRDFEKVYEYDLIIDAYKDSLNAVAQNEEIAERDAQLNNIQLRLEKEHLETRNKMVVIGSSVVLLLLIVGTVVANDIAKRRRLQRQKAKLEEEVARKTAELVNKNAQLEEQKEEIQSQNEQLEMQNSVINQINRDLTDSIDYASTIQTSILPDLRQFVGEGGIAGSFTIFIPCKVVSGDFYWARRRPDALIFVCADCTGHGVPGALMSMIGSTLLTQIGTIEPLPTAAEMLELLDRRLKYLLSQNINKNSKDGMDLSVAVYKPETHKLQLSSAHRPVYVRQKGELIEVKGTKRSIGERDLVICSTAFENVEIEVSKGDTIYMSSDGIADQLGGKELNGVEKRLKKSGFRRWIEEVKNLPIAEQDREIHRRIVEWKNGSEQVDDMSMVGIEF
ncbi:MAG: SpoIIE family protein phosphatase [Bacteroidales bacterium]|nr:SpoIIE family protein phosphatase [Bacteroidales bacterium]